MKIFPLLIALCIFFNVASIHAQGWYHQFTAPVTTLNIHFINKDTGWAGSLYTSNGGETWASYQNGRYVLQFVDRKHGWAFSDSGSNWVAATIDGGETWIDYKIANKELGIATGKQFCDSLHGYIAFSNVYISATNDGGKTWNIAEYEGDKIYCFGCFTPTRVNAGGWGGDWKVYNGYTTDGGKQWTRLEFPTYPITFEDFAVTDSTTIYAVGRMVLRSTNRGFTWKTILDTNFGSFDAISATDTNNISIVGGGGRIVRTKDAWKTHEYQNSGVSYPLYDVFFIDSTTGWATGSNTILHTTNAGMSWVQQLIPKPLTTSVSPEPFGRKTTITYELPSAMKVKIRMYNILGKELEVIESPGIQDAGTHSIEFDGSRYPEGTFHYKIETDGFYGTGKMTKVVY